MVTKIATRPMRLQESGNSQSRATRKGFTLVELLVVITIIIILMGLLTPVVMIAIANAKEARIIAEIATLDSAFKAYKEKHGSYPPSDFTNITNTASPQYIALALHIQKSYPRCNVATEIAAITTANIKTPAQAVVFWLAGFCSDPEQPISGIAKGLPRDAPLFVFDQTRYLAVSGSQGPVYCPADTPGVPYVYFASQSYATHVTNPFVAATYNEGQGTLRPYASDPVPVSPNNPTPANPSSFQIISAGLDSDFGGGGAGGYQNVAYFPSGTAYATGDKDNLTNFSSKNLGDAIPR